MQSSCRNCNTAERCAEMEKQIRHDIFPLSSAPIRAANEASASLLNQIANDANASSYRSGDLQGGTYAQAARKEKETQASGQPKHLSRRALLFRTRPEGAEVQTSRHLLAAESPTHDQFRLSRRSMLGGLALAGALRLGIPFNAATDRLMAQSHDPAGVAPWTNASEMITPIWQGEQKEYQNQREWQREHDHTCCPTSIATVLNAWQNEHVLMGRPSIHIRDVLHDAMRQRAYISGAGTYWMGSIASIAARFGFRTIWGYDAASYLAYTASVFDTMAGHNLFKELEYVIFGPIAPRLVNLLKQQARAIFHKETQNKASREVPLEQLLHIATCGFPVIVDLWSPQMPQG